MELTRHHFRIMYIIAETGTIAPLLHQWDASIEHLQQLGFLQHTCSKTHLSALGYETIGWIPIELSEGFGDPPENPSAWMPGPNFQWTSLL